MTERFFRPKRDSHTDPEARPVTTQAVLSDLPTWRCPTCNALTLPVPERCPNCNTNLIGQGATL